MVFADNIVLTEGIWIDLNGRLDTQNGKLEENGLKINTTNNNYLWSNFSGEQNGEEVEVCIREQVLQQMEALSLQGFTFIRMQVFMMMSLTL